VTGTTEMPGVRRLTIASILAMAPPGICQTQGHFQWRERSILKMATRSPIYSKIR
jgi:hypothetical protein